MVAAKRPFFAVVWFGNPHGPHQALEKDKAPYKHLSEKLQNYYGEITGVNRGMATLRKALKGKAGGAALDGLVDDAAETKDIASAKPDVAAKMKAPLEAWQKSVERNLAGKEYT